MAKSNAKGRPASRPAAGGAKASGSSPAAEASGSSAEASGSSPAAGSAKASASASVTAHSFDCARMMTANYVRAIARRFRLNPADVANLMDAVKGDCTH